MNDDTRAAWVAAQEWHDTECLNLQLCCNVIEAAEKLINEQAEENARLKADWEMYLSEPHDVFVALREEIARLRAALGVAEEAVDFAVGALSDAVADMLDKPAGYAVIRMGKDALRLHIKPALRAPGQRGMHIYEP